MNEQYDDIINLPHHVSKRHTPMSMHERAAQFAPFAALTGYDDSIAESATASAHANDDHFEPYYEDTCIIEQIKREPRQ